MFRKRPKKFEKFYVLLLPSKQKTLFTNYYLLVSNTKIDYQKKISEEFNTFCVDIAKNLAEKL